MVVNGLEVLRGHRPRRHPRLRTQTQRDVTHQVFDELGIVVGALGHPLFVGALEQAEHLARGFFLGNAQVWRSKAREDALKSQIATDPHSPERLRAIVPVRNLDEWYAAFNIGPDSKFYIPPEKRAKIW